MMADDQNDLEYASQFEEYDGEEIDIDADDVIGEFVGKGLVGSRYTARDEIARGGMGIIYKVRDVGLDRVTVLKVINPELISNADLLTRFIEEARITGQLEHPNIVPVHDIGVIDGEEIYFSMKAIEGREFRDILEDVRLASPDNSPMSLFGLLTIFRKVCDAVAFAHSRNIIHRDIKPDNVLVGNYGEVLLVDWGLARRADRPDLDRPHSEIGLLDPGASGSVTRTRYGIIKGTPAYMAPEMARGETDKIDFRSDIFLLGSTLYALSCLEAPFTDDGPDDIYKILQRAEHCRFIPPTERSPECQIPRELERIIMKAMAADRDDRYQSVEELSNDIDALMEGRAHSERRLFPTGKHLMVEGDEGTEAYVINSGTARVYKTINGKPTVLVVLGPGSTVGEMALIDQAPRSASVIAETDCEVTVINERTLRESLDKLPPWLERTISSLTSRLRNTNTDIHPLMHTDGIYHVMNMIRLLYPFCGQPAEDPNTNEAIIVLHAERMLLEIAVQLCIPAERVLQLISRILRTGLVRVVSEDYFSIPNFNLYCNFLEFVRQAFDTPSGIPAARMASFFDTDGVLTLALSDGSVAVMGEGEYTQQDPLKILVCSSSEEIPERFEQLFYLLMDSNAETDQGAAQE